MLRQNTRGSSAGHLVWALVNVRLTLGSGNKMESDPMAVTVASSQSQFRQGLPGDLGRAGRVYAIGCDMDIEALRTYYGVPNNACLEVRRVLQRNGFTWQQGSVYFGGEAVTAVTCVLAEQDLARSLPWFAASVRDIRMLRIEELNDLMPAVQQASGQE
jgi:virulence-associated protein VapD